MVKLSNKVIFVILAATLVIALTGTFVNMGRWYGLDYLGLTGAATSSDQGNATIVITQQTVITNNFNDISFGSGFVNQSCTVCNMDSNGTFTRGCCGTFNFSNIYGFLLENTGNVNLSVNYTCAGNCTAAQFIGGTNPAFQIRATNNFNAGQSGEVGAADTVASCSGQGFSDFNFTTYVDVTAAGDYLCGNNTNYPLDFKNAQDAFVVDLNISIPSDAPAGSQKSTIFTFNALATG